MKLLDLIYKDEYITVSSKEILNYNIYGISSDSRKIQSGYAFVALGGIHTDGTLYAGEAKKLGACVCICERIPALCDIPYVIVPNIRKILSFMLYRFYGSVCGKMNIFALTGTNGKTSTAAFLKQIFVSAGVKTGSIGTLKGYINNDRFCLDEFDEEKMSTMTTPDPEQFYRMTYEMYKAGVTYLVLEASSHALKLDKLAPIHFKAAAFLNFSSDHLDFHLDTGDYLNSKCKIFPMSDKVYINADDTVCRAAINVYNVPCFTYAAKFRDADYKADNIRLLGYNGVAYELKHKENILPIYSHILGDFTVYNTLAAASVALGEGVDYEYILKAISDIKTINGRLERIPMPKEHSDIAVFIDYAHTETAMENLLLAVAKIKDEKSRVITLFGCGGERDKEKRAPMARIASQYSDMVIITEDNPRAENINCIIDDIMQGIDTERPYEIIKNRKKAIEYAIKNAKHGDIILLVGKGHEQYEITEKGKVSFSERETVYDALKQRKAGGENERKI